MIKFARKLEDKNISVPSKIFGISIWMLLFTYEGSFMVQSLLGFIILLAIFALKERKIQLNNSAKILLFLVAHLTFSTIINFIIHIDLASESAIIGILYFMLIAGWFILNTEKRKNVKEINFILNNYIIVTTIASLISIYYGVILNQGGKIALINLIGVEIDENYSSALISVGVIFLFLKLLYSIRRNKINFVKWLLLFIINIVGVSVIGSRASMLACIISIVAGFILYLVNDMNTKKILVGVVFLIIGIFSIKIALNYMPQWTYERYFQNSYLDTSNSIRITYWKNAFDATLDSPLFGFGFGFYTRIPEYQNFDYFDITPESAPAHQTYLDIMIYGGFVGLVIFILFIITVITKVLNRKTIMLIPLAINLLFISNIIGADKSVFFWNTLIIIFIISEYLLKEENAKIEDCFK